MMTFSRLHITIFVALAVVVWVLALLAQGSPVTLDALWPFSTVVSVLVGVGLLFEYYLWHLKVFHGWLVKRPDLRGTWRVELASTWIDPRTGVEVAPIQAFMAITQTLSRLQMQLMTAESESWLVADQISPSRKNDGYSIFAVYTNEPNTRIRGVRSEIHYGALALDTHGPAAKPDRINGQYWTDRGTKGMMEFSHRMDAVHSRFEDARAAASSAGV